jgi:hypothetical protein
MSHIQATQTSAETTIKCTCGAGFVMSTGDSWLERMLRAFRERHGKCGGSK